MGLQGSNGTAIHQHHHNRLPGGEQRCQQLFLDGRQAESGSVSSFETLKFQSLFLPLETGRETECNNYRISP